MKRQNRVAFFNILSTLLLRGISIFTGPLFTRMLGTGGYGELSIYNIWVSVLAIAFTMQTQGTLINARVEYPADKQSGYQSSVMSLSLMVFLLCGGVTVLFLKPISDLLGLHWGLVLLMLLQAFGTFCTNFLNNKLTYEFKAGRNMLLSLGITLTTLVTSVILIRMMPEEYNYVGRVLALSLTYGGLGIGVCVYILRKGKTFYNRDYWKLCIPLALPAVFYNLSDLALGQSDQVMLRQMLGSAFVGQYSYALKFGGIMFTIFCALNNSWAPFFFEDFKNGERDKVKKQARNFLELFTVLSAGFILLGQEVFHVYARQDFWAGTPLIPIFVTSFFLNFLCTFPINFEFYHKKTKVVATVTITSSLINIALNYFLIGKIGMAGAAIATCLSHCFQFTVHYVYTRYFLHPDDFPFGVTLWAKYALCYLTVVAIVYLLPNLWQIRWGLGAFLGLWEVYRVKKRKVLI